VSDASWWSRWYPGAVPPEDACDIADIYALFRFVAGAPVGIGNDCPAFRP
jgi:hypothetical protein